MALKVFDTRLRGPRLVARFEKESRIRLAHPNVVDVKGAGIDAGIPWIALELLEGTPLDARFGRSPPLTPREIVDLGAQVCRGLEAAHALSVVHRDLKPENLFLCRDGTLKILDFGIAILAAQRITTTGQIVGTPAYLSPEQARGDDDIDARTDIWSLGCLLYEACTGQPPFERTGLLATILAILRDSLPPIATIAPAVPAPLASVVERCLVKERDGRWSSAAALRRALEELDLDRTPPPGAAKAPGSASIAPGEQRVVAILLAEDAADRPRIATAVQANGGTYFDLYGRRAVGLFGVVAWEGDEVERAANAAMACRGAAARLSIAAGRASSHGSAISGEALEAAEEGCRAGIEGVAIDHRAADLLGERHGAEPVGDLLRLVERRRPSSVAPRPADRESAGLLGREAELSMLDQAVRAFAHESRTQAVLVVGPAGIGKTRLREELEHRLYASVPSLTLLSARASSLGQRSSHALIAAAIEDRAWRRAEEPGVPSIDPERPLPERQRAVWGLAGEAFSSEALLEQTAPFLGELMGVDMGERPSLSAARSDPTLMADRLRMAVRDYFRALCSAGPTALILEDAQWADAASLALLGELLELLGDAPFLLFVTARPWLEEERPDFLAEHEVLRIEPRPLGARDALELARVAADDGLSDALLAIIAERCGGNPLFIEQTAQEAVEAVELGLGEDVDPPLSLTAEAAIQSRLDHLPLLEKEACKRAAILGRPFRAGELEALGVQDPLALLTSLRRRGVLTARASSGSPEGRVYRFQVALVGEVAREMLSEDLRAELHRRAAQLLERQTDPDHEELAQHWDRGGERERAAARYAAATMVAAGRGDVDTVLRCSDTAFYLGVPERFLFELHMARGEAYSHPGRFVEQERELEAALSQTGSAAERARVWSERIGCYWRLGRGDRALAAAGEAAEAARLGGDAEQLAITLSRQVNVLAMSGQHEEARQALQAADALGDALSVGARALREAARAQLATATDDFAIKEQARRTAIRLYESIGDLRRAANSESNLADAYNRVGAYASAEAALRAALEDCRRVGNRMALGYASANLAYTLGRTGRFEEALACLGEAAEVAEATGERYLRVFCRIYELRILLDAGRGVELTACLETAEEAAALGNRPSEAHGLCLGARAALAKGDGPRARDLSARALAIRDEIGGLNEDEVEIYLVHAAALRVCGEPAAADAVREAGRARLLEIAGRIGDAALRRRFLDDIPAHRELANEGPG